MEKPGCGQASPFLKKGKKKQAKDELDRQKQAEKKRRRLEKALANSAAIRSELEKKKQKKKEEQQRLDEEGAAIAEAVALQVLVGEDMEESHHFMLDHNRRYRNNPYYNSDDIGLFMGYQGFGKYSIEGLEWPDNAFRSLPNEARSPFYDTNYWPGSDISAGIIAAQAVESLQIAEDLPHGGGATVVFNRMMGSSNMGGGVNFYKEI